MKCRVYDFYVERQKQKLELTKVENKVEPKVATPEKLRQISKTFSRLFWRNK